MYLYAKFHFIFYRQQIWNKTANHECSRSLRPTSAPLRNVRVYTDLSSQLWKLHVTGSWYNTHTHTHIHMGGGGQNPHVRHDSAPSWASSFHACRSVCRFLMAWRRDGPSEKLHRYLKFSFIAIGFYVHCCGFYLPLNVHFTQFDIRGLTVLAPVSLMRHSSWLAVISQWKSTNCN